MKTRKTSNNVVLAISVAVLIVGCQSGENKVEEGNSVQGKQEDQILAVAAAEDLLPAQQDAIDAFQKGDKRLLGVQTRGVSIPGVDDALLPELRKRYGVALRSVNDVIKSEEDRDSLTEVFQYVREYNGKMAQLLSNEVVNDVPRDVSNDGPD